MELNEFIKKFASLFDETTENEFNADTKFKELEEWSSLEALCIIAMTEEDFKVQINSDDIRRSDTIEDLFNAIISKIS